MVGVYQITYGLTLGMIMGQYPLDGIQYSCFYIANIYQLSQQTRAPRCETKETTTTSTTTGTGPGTGTTTTTTTTKNISPDSLKQYGFV